MPTIDGDWTCESDSATGSGCYAIWQSCDHCLPTIPELAGSYNGGLVPKGQGLSIAAEEGNIWHVSDDRAAVDGKYDICPHCTGSGGGYACGVHDFDESALPDEQPIAAEETDE